VDTTTEQARDELVRALLDLSSLAIAMADTIIKTDDPRPGELITYARRTRLQALTVLTAAIRRELAGGTRWPHVAEALGLSEADARAIHQDDYTTWRATTGRRRWGSRR
jgi:hypothetical protein